MDLARFTPGPEDLSECKCGHVRLAHEDMGAGRPAPCLHYSGTPYPGSDVICTCPDFELAASYREQGGRR